MGEHEVIAQMEALKAEFRAPGRRAQLIQRAEATLSEANPSDLDKLEAVKLAWALLEDEQFDAASTLYERLRALSPTEAYYWTACGACRLGQGRLEEAVDLLSQAIAKNPGDGTALINRGEALLRLDRRDDALADFKRAIELAPSRDHPDIELAVRMVVALTPPE